MDPHIKCPSSEDLYRIILPLKMAISSTIQILDELLMMYIYLNIDYTWGISNIYNKRKILLSDSVCAYGHTREQSAQ